MLYISQRPPIPEDCLPGLANLLRKCWDPNPSVSNMQLTYLQLLTKGSTKLEDYLALFPGSSIPEHEHRSREA